MTGFLRSIRYWTWVSLRIVGIGVIAAFGFGILLGFMSADKSEGFNMICTYLLLFGLFLMISQQVAAATSYIQICISMGANRRETFFSLQYANVMVAGVFYVITLLFQLAAGSFLNYHDWQIDAASVFPLYLVLALGLGGLGNLFGMLIFRLGKIGMVILCLFAGVGGGIMGMLMATGSTVLMTPVLNRIWLLILLAAVVYAVCSAVQYLFIRRYELHA